MDNIEFIDTLLLRAPLYSYAGYDPELLEEVILQTDFQHAIQLASRDFYELLAARSFVYRELNEKEKHTLLKYYNRICFRAVPFGMFASFTSLKWADGASVYLAPRSGLRLHLIADRAVFAASERRRDIVSENLSLRINPLLYSMGKMYRYIRSSSDEQGRYRFLLQALRAESFYKRLFARISGGPLTARTVLGYICKITGCSEAAGQEQLAFLISEQLLLPQTHGAMIERNPVGLPFRSLSSREDNLHYAVMERPLISGGPGRTDREELTAALKFLALVSAPATPEALSRFTRDFKQRYDQEQVPLLLAMDPDAGLPYHDLAQDEHSRLLEGLRFPDADESAPLRDWTALHRLILQLWNKSGKDKYSPLQLNELPLDELKNQAKSAPLAPSGAVMFRKMGDHLLIEHAGGATAVALAGRFTLFSEALLAACGEVAGLEAEANPNVVFADIGQLSDDHVDNINRRARIYPYEIPLNVYSTLAKEDLLQPSDLLLSVREDQLILESKRLGKRVIPRLTTAYNYRHNNLPVFRLLCDLQYQGIHANLGIDLENLFPGMNFYPRVCFGRTVLGPARWLFSAAQLATLSDGYDREVFRAFREQYHLPARVLLGRGDQQLAFDLNQPAEAQFFIACLKGQANITLTELLVQDRSVKGADGPLGGQFVAFFHNEQTVYPLRNTTLQTGHTHNRVFWPGSEWLYLKIYCSAASADHLLATAIGPVLKAEERNFHHWFFIRYYDPGHHLRLRIRLDPVMVGPILGSLGARLKAQGHELIVHDYQGATYRRELERYPAAIVELVEKLFHAGSELVITYLNAREKQRTELPEIGLALLTLEFFLKIFLQGKDREETVAFCENVTAGFLKEFGQEKMLRTDLDSKYREMRKMIAEILSQPDKKKLGILGYQKAMKGLECRLRVVLRAALGIKGLNNYGLFTDLIHMQINRTFRSDQRRQELVMYYFYSKFLKGCLAREKG